LFRRKGEYFATGAGDDDCVLYAGSPEPRDVHAGLDGHYLTGTKYILRRCPDPRRLVDVEADPVTGAVHEILPQSGGFDHLAAGPVDLDRRHAVGYGGDTCLLGGPYDAD
jgi:hypothetical protein